MDPASGICNPYDLDLAIATHRVRGGRDGRAPHLVEGVSGVVGWGGREGLLCELPRRGIALCCFYHGPGEWHLQSVRPGSSNSHSPGPRDGSTRAPQGRSRRGGCATRTVGSGSGGQELVQWWVLRNAIVGGGGDQAIHGRGGRLEEGGHPMRGRVQHLWCICDCTVA